MESAGDVFTCGMGLLDKLQWRSREDSFLVEKFRSAGFLQLGKTNTPELGLSVTTEPACYGPTRNPWNLEYSVGGSSGGAAAAVASGMVPIAHGSDGGGSIRIPASECGLVGFKPSRGRVSEGPHVAQRWAGFITNHVLTRSVRDSAAVLDATAGWMPGDPYSAPGGSSFLAATQTEPASLRIGVLGRSTRSIHVDEQCAHAVASVVRVLEMLHHHVEESYPPDFADPSQFFQDYMTLVAASTARLIDQWQELLHREINEADLEQRTWLLVALGRSISAVKYLEVLDRLSLYTRRLAQWWAGGFDLLLSPTIATPPPKIGYFGLEIDPMLKMIPFTPPFNATGQPAVSLPLAWSPDGLPIGVQLVAAYGREDLLFQIAAQLERAMPWKDRIPSLSSDGIGRF